MAWQNSPFQGPCPPSTLSGSSDTITTCVLIQGDRLYLGTSTGSLLIYSYDEELEWELSEVKKGLCKGKIEDLGFVRDVNSLIVLGDSTITLYPLPSFSPSTPLTVAKGALSFALDSCIQQGEGDLPTLITRLLVGCRRRIILYEWIDGELSNPKDLSLPHTPRAITFLNSNCACLGYTSDMYTVLDLSSSAMQVSDITLPQAPTTTSGALSGYLIPSLSLGGKEAKPIIVNVGDREVIVCRDNEGILIPSNIEQCRRIATWSQTPIHVAYVHPYLLSVVSPQFIEIRSRLSVYTSGQWPVVANIPIPSLIPSIIKHILTTEPKRSGGGERGFLVVAATPTAGEETKIARVQMKPWKSQIEGMVAEGRYDDALRLVDSLGSKGSNSGLSDDPNTLNAHLRTLQALHAFLHPPPSSPLLETFENSLQTFISLNVNPFMVISLFPKEVSSRLSSIYLQHPSHAGKEIEEKDKEELWKEITFGPLSTHASQAQHAEEQTEGSTGPSAHESNKHSALQLHMPSGSTSLRIGRLGNLGSFLGAAASGSTTSLGDDEKEDDASSVCSSIGGTGKRKKVRDEQLNALLTYLSTLRPRIGGLLRESKDIAEESKYTDVPIGGLIPLPVSPDSVEVDNAKDMANFGVYVPLSHPIATSVDPQSAPQSLSISSLTLVSQLIDTSLVHIYLTIPSRLSLLPSLARLKDSRVVIEDVENRMKELSRWADLREMWRNKGGKKGHGKALEVVREEFGGIGGVVKKDRDDGGRGREMINIVIDYLGKLREEDWDVVQENATWVWDVLKPDRDKGMESAEEEEEWDAKEVLDIFTSGTRSEPLPPKRVCDFFLSLSSPTSPRRTTPSPLTVQRTSSQLNLTLMSQTTTMLCIKYIEYILGEYGFTFRQTGVDEMLVGFYLDAIFSYSRQKDEIYSKLLKLLESEEYFDVGRVYGMVLGAIRNAQQEDLPEARAILLGKLGKHEQALEVYVYKMKEFGKALEYCMKLYRPGSSHGGIFLTLLNIYLCPSPSHGENIEGMEKEFLEAAIQLLSTQPSASCLPIDQVMGLLPPFLELSKLGPSSTISNTPKARGYLPTSLTALAASLHQTKLTLALRKSLLDASSSRLVLLESKRVKVDYGRTCPVCMKLLAGGRGGGGGGVVSVHFPRGEVTHYQCREAFKVKARR